MLCTRISHILSSWRSLVPPWYTLRSELRLKLTLMSGSRDIMVMHSRTHVHVQYTRLGAQRLFRGCHCQDDLMYGTIEEVVVVAVRLRLNLLEN